MGEPNVVTLHVRYRLLFRHMRGYLLGVVCISFALGLVGGLLARLTHSNRTAPPGHSSGALGLGILIGVLLTLPYMVWGSRRMGFYARPGELGIVTVFGRLMPFRQPTVRFRRFTMTNWRWIRFIDMGRLATVPAIVGIDETGRRCLALTPAIYPQVEIDRFLAASGLPVEGDWSERVARFSVRKRWPGSKDTRRQGWMAAGAMLSPVLLLAGGVVAPAFLVR